MRDGPHDQLSFWAAPPWRTYPQRMLIEQVGLDLATARLARA
jgi:hypothetical protein